MNINKDMNIKALTLLCVLAIINNMTAMSIIMGAGRLAFDMGAGALSTIPVGINYFAIMFGAIPVSYLFIRFGIRFGLIIVNIFSALASSGIILSIEYQSFALLLISLFFMGVSLSAMHQIRYIATDTVNDKYKPIAMSLILSMPIFGGLIFPSIVDFMQNTYGTNHYLSGYTMLYVTQFLLIATAIVMLCVFRLNINYKPKSKKIDLSILKKKGLKPAILITALGYSVMTFLMTATPLYMQSIGYSLGESNTLIGYHVVGMSLPSLIIAYIIVKFGISSTVKIGMAVYSGVFVFNVFGGDSYISLMMGLILLGVGWSATYSGGSNYITKVLTTDERMRAQGIADTFVFMGTGIAGFLSGLTMYYIGWLGTNLILVISIIIIAIANYRLKSIVK
ncbi:MAG: MFS transporter [Alphaproteobacteria bacterium]